MATPLVAMRLEEGLRAQITLHKMAMNKADNGHDWSLSEVIRGVLRAKFPSSADAEAIKELAKQQKAASASRKAQKKGGLKGQKKKAC